MFTRKWWHHTLERATKTAAQTFIAVFGANTAGWLTTDWKFLAISIAGMTALSLATSIITTPFGNDKDSPQL